ncbi:hypothetical protein ACFW04_014673 [Cataglyphis niger]
MVSSLEEETKDLQIEEQNAMIDKERNSDLQFIARCFETPGKAPNRCVISRVLHVSWKKITGRSIFLPRTTIAYRQKRRQLNFDDLLIDQAMQEVLFMFSGEQKLLRNIVVDILLGYNGSQSSLPVTSPFYPLPMSILISSNSIAPQSKSLNYLLDCYSRIATEKRKHPKRSSAFPISDVLPILKEKCVEYSSHVLKGLVDKCQIYLPGYLHDFMTSTCTDLSRFNEIFTPVLQSLFLLIQRASLFGYTHRRPINALSKLIEICCDSNNNIRSIRFLIINQIQFFLGPFLLVSVIRKAEKFFSGDSVTDKSVILMLQRELQSTKTSLYKIFDTIPANNMCRDAIFEYLTEDASSLVKDGFMLNLLSILQMLCMMIELNTVDPLYPFNSSTFIKIKKDTRLKLTLQEAAEWQKRLENTHGRMKPTFTTKCWFLTLHCHHIALLPALRPYREISRDLQKKQKKFDEYQIANLQRENSFNFLIGFEDFIEQRWTQDLKQLVKSKLCSEAGSYAQFHRTTEMIGDIVEFLLFTSE